MPVITHQMIEAFRASVMHGGISAAAEALGTSQPSVSRVLAELQKAVGFQLFVKHGRTVKPTQEALALMTKVAQSFLGLEDIARFSEQLRKQMMGRLAICAIPAVGHSIMPDAIHLLRQKYPNVVVRLDIMSSAEVVRSVSYRQSDIGFGAHGLNVGEVESVAEFAADCVCIAPAKGMLNMQGPVQLKQLAGKPFIVLTGAVQKWLEEMTKDLGTDMAVVTEASQSISCSELVMRGAGVAIVDPFTGALHRSRGGVVLPLETSLPFKVQALAMSDTRLSIQAKELIQYLQAAARGIAAHGGDTYRP